MDCKDKDHITCVCGKKVCIECCRATNIPFAEDDEDIYIICSCGNDVLENSTD